jgi:hypothetical protein
MSEFLGHCIRKIPRSFRLSAGEFGTVVLGYCPSRSLELRDD